MIFLRKTRIIPRKTAQRKVKERKVKERKENESKENKIKVARLRQQGAVGNRPRRQHAARLSAAHTQMEQFDYHNNTNLLIYRHIEKNDRQTSAAWNYSKKKERMTGLEPATSTLARWRSTR